MPATPEPVGISQGHNGVGDTIAYNGNTLVWSSAVTVSADGVHRNCITQSMNYICVRKLHT